PMTRGVVVGDLMTDAVAHALYPLARGSDTAATVSMHGGGSGANIAAWLAVDGNDVAFVGRRGADIAGRNRDMELMGYGVDARLVMDPERPTGTCVVMVTHKGENTMLSDPGANSALSPDDLPRDLFAAGNHMHVSGYTLLSEGARPAALAAIQYSIRAGMSVSVDAASSAPRGRAGAEPFLELSNGATLLFVNEAESQVLTGRDDAEQAARVLTSWYPQVVIKMGADGALFYANGRPPVHVPAPPVDHIVDGTGAGDAFCAGFLASWLDKKPPGEALASGCRLASHAMGLVGARPVLSSVYDYLRSLFGLDGRVALVTGGSAGIGRGIAGALAGAGARVVILARGEAALKETVAELEAAGGGAAWVSADLADRAAVTAGADEAAAAFGEPDILVNCAGINLRAPMPELTVGEWDQTMAVNLTAPFLLGQRFGPGMAERGWGRIINVTSQQYHRAFGNSGGYGPSKAGLAALTRSQSEAWSRSGVTVNSVCPGFVPTALNAVIANDPKRSAAMVARTMAGRNGAPEDFAGAAVFLARDSSAFVTAQTVYVDGGVSAT